MHTELVYSLAKGEYTRPIAGACRTRLFTGTERLITSACRTRLFTGTERLITGACRTRLFTGTERLITGACRTHLFTGTERLITGACRTRLFTGTERLLFARLITGAHRTCLFTSTERSHSSDHRHTQRTAGMFAGTENITHTALFTLTVFICSYAQSFRYSSDQRGYTHLLICSLTVAFAHLTSVHRENSLVC